MSFGTKSKPQHSNPTSNTSPLSLARATLEKISKQCKESSTLKVPQDMIHTSLLEVPQENDMQDLHQCDLELTDLELEVVYLEGEEPATPSVHTPPASETDSHSSQAPTLNTPPDSPIDGPSNLNEVSYLQHQGNIQAKKKPKGRAARARASKRKFSITNLGAHTGFIRMANINVRGSLVNRLPLLKLHLVKQKIDIMACTETGLFQSQRVGNGLSYYFAPYKNSDSRGAGVIVRNSVPHVELTHSFPVKIIEIVIVGVMLQDVNIAFCSLYTPGRMKTITLERYNEMHELNERLRAQGWSPLWAGDFNAKIGSLPLGIVGNHPEIDCSGRALVELAHSSDLYIANKHPECTGKWTRVEGQSRSIIDYFLLDNFLVDRFHGMFIDENKTLIVRSDHNLMWLDLLAKPPHSEDISSTLKWNVPSDDQWKAFKDRLSNALTPYVTGNLPSLSSPDPDVREFIINQESEVITKAILQSAEDSIGKRTVKGNIDSVPTSVSSKVAAYKSALSQYREALESDPKPVQAAMWKGVKIAKENLDRELRNQANKEAKKLADIAKKSNSKTPLWKIRRQTAGKPSNKLIRPVRRNRDDSMVTRPPEIQKIVNEYATNLYGIRGNNILTEGDNPPSPNQSNSLENQGLLEPFSLEEVSGIIKNLKDLKSPGPDTIPNEFLKGGGVTLHRALALFYSRCILAECTPESWGQANTTMLFKKGDPSLLDNYRGIAMSDTIGKVFCSAINSRLVDILELNKIFGDLQFGFRKDFRTQDALFILSHILHSRKQSGHTTYAAFLDLKKAYDVVDRQMLWERLSAIGLPVNFVTLLQSLYRNTITRVQYGNIFSDTIHVESGVRQGCPLSPTLFNIFISGLTDELVQSKLGVQLGKNIIPALFFADDMVILAQSESQLRSLLDLVGSFATRKGLAFNGPKSSVLVFNSTSHEKKVWTLQGAPIFESDQAEITEDTEYQYLGVTISSTKSLFCKQEVNMVTKLARDAKILPTLFPRAPGRPALQELVWRQVSLASCFYGSEIIVPKKGTVDTLDRIQRIVGRKILYDRAKSTNEGIHGELGWLPVEYLLHVRCMCYRTRLENMSQDRLTKRVFLHCKELPHKSKWLELGDDLFKKYEIDLKSLGSKTNQAIKSKIKNQVMKAFDKSWLKNQSNKPTMRFMKVAHQPGTIPRFLDGSKPGFWLHRARTDELPLNSRVFPRSSVECPHCPSMKETLEHVLLECPEYEPLRVKFYDQLQQESGIDLNLLPQSQQLQGILGFNVKNPRLQAMYIYNLARLRGLSLCKDSQPIEDLEEIITQWSKATGDNLSNS